MDAPFREQADGGRRIDGGGSAGQKSGELETPRLEARSAGPDAWVDVAPAAASEQQRQGEAESGATGQSIYCRHE